MKLNVLKILCNSGLNNLSNNKDKQLLITVAFSDFSNLPVDGDDIIKTVCMAYCPKSYSLHQDRDEAEDLHIDDKYLYYTWYYEGKTEEVWGHITFVFDKDYKFVKKIINRGF